MKAQRVDPMNHRASVAASGGSTESARCCSSCAEASCSSGCGSGGGDSRPDDLTGVGLSNSPTSLPDVLPMLKAVSSTPAPCVSLSYGHCKLQAHQNAREPTRPLGLSALKWSKAVTLAPRSGNRLTRLAAEGLRVPGEDMSGLGADCAAAALLLVATTDSPPPPPPERGWPLTARSTVLLTGLLSMPSPTAYSASQQHTTAPHASADH